MPLLKIATRHDPMGPVTLTIAAGAGVTSPGVIVTTNAVNGVHVGATARANIDTLTSTGNVNGLLCDASAGVSTQVWP